MSLLNRWTKITQKTLASLRHAASRTDPADRISNGMPDSMMLSGETAIRVAIDFGTERVKLAFCMPSNGRAELLRFGGEQDRSFVPSLFYLPQGSTTILFGDAAEAQLVDAVDEFDPGQTAGFPALPVKRQLLARRIRAGDRAETPLALLSAMFCELATKLATELPGHPDPARVDLVLTLPPSFGPSERELLVAAAKAGGFAKADADCLIEEPVAAARAWLAESGGSADAVIVLDCGGGTVDWAYLERGTNGFSQHPSCPEGGITGLGGHDVDLGLLELVEEKAAALGMVEIPLRTMRPRLLSRLRRLKEAVSQGRAPWPIEIGRERLTLTREEIADVVHARFLARTVDGLRGYLSRVKAVRDSALPAVLLVGGSARLPGLKAAIEALGVETASWDRADFATVLGALVSANPGTLPVLSTPAIQAVTQVTQVIPPFMYSNGKILIVDAHGRRDDEILQSKLDDAEPGTRIIVRPGYYKGRLYLSRSVEIIGEGDRDLIIIDHDGKYGTILSAAPDVRISGVSIYYSGKNNDQAILISNGRFVVDNCNIIVRHRGYGIVVEEYAKAFIAENRIHNKDVVNSSNNCIYIKSINRCDIIGNEIIGSAKSIYVSGDSLIKNNIINGYRKWAIFVALGNASIIEDNKIYNSNNVDIASLKHISFTSSYGVVYEGDKIHFTIRNNTFVEDMLSD